MRSLLFLAISFVLGASQAEAENFRFNPLPLKDYQASLKDANSARLKVSVTLDDHAVTKPLKIGGIVICSVSACYRPNTVANNVPASAGAATAQLVVDSIIPFTQIDSIYFESLKGGDVAGSISLATPLKIEGGYYGGEIFVTVAQSNIRQSALYTPVYAASNLIRESGASIYYNPKFAAKVELGTGVTLSMPAYATKHPTILNVKVNDIGARYPLVDIYPYLGLIKPATLTAKTLQTEKTIALNSVRASTVDLIRQQATPAQPQVNKTISAFATFNPSFFEGSTVTAADYTECRNRIDANNTVNQIIADAKANRGIAYYDGCVNIPPYIHIVYVDMFQDNRTMNIVSDVRPYQATPTSPVLQKMYLKPIRDHAAQSWTVAINGFYWEGDKGDGEGQVGVPAGYVMANGVVQGSNIVSGGITGSNMSSAGNKLIMSWASNYAYGPINYIESSTVGYRYPGAVNQISSSTSVIKNEYDCQTDATRSRWTAIGSNYFGGILMISSTSSGETDATELCPIMRQFRTAFALRLDGGPTAAMTVKGVHVNPLTGLYSFKYGDARRIPYVVQVGL